jgi:hypothetical protein
VPEAFRELRRFGYAQDAEDRWVHRDFGLECQDPAALLALPEALLLRFHDPLSWADHLRPAERPALPAALQRLVREHELIWDGWLEAFEAPGGNVYVSVEEMERLGAERLDEVLSRIEVFYDRRAMRLLGSCSGMGIMVLWLAGGWLVGVPGWLIGMAIIAVGTWLLRPRRMPESMWAGIDQEVWERAVDEAREMVGEDWDDLALATGAVPVDEEHVHLTVVGRTIALETLWTFDAEQLNEVLSTLAPIEVDED